MKQPNKIGCESSANNKKRAPRAFVYPNWDKMAAEPRYGLLTYLVERHLPAR